MEQEFGAWEGLINAGGIRHLKLLAATDVLDVLDPERYPDPMYAYPMMSANNIVLQDNLTVYSIVFGKDSASFAWNRQDTPNGDLYSVSISFEVPKIQQGFLAWLDQNRQRRWIALVEDRNKECYLFGDPKNALRQVTSAVTGNRASDRNRQSITMTVQLNHIPWLLTNLDLSRPEFSNEFSYEFNI